MTEKRNHLWIPANEIDNVPKKPTGRSNEYDIKHTEHGQKLSQGLQHIVEFFQHLQSSNLIDELDLVTFKLILQDKEDIANQKNFIENEGLTINAVKDSNNAIVSAPQNIFANLRERISRYRDYGTKKDFQYIQGFEPFTADDKKASSIIRYVKDNPDTVSVDLQIMLLPDMKPDVQKLAQINITNRIINKNGIVKGAPYQLTDGTTIIRASLTPSGLNEIANDPHVYWVEKTIFFHSYHPSDVSPFTDELIIDTNIDVAALPAVVILDDGVSLPASLESIVPIHWKASDCNINTSFGNHGTPVASRVAFGYIGMQMSDVFLTPRARIIDAKIADSDEIPVDVVLQRIQEAVKTFADYAKIFNFSYNANSPIEGSEMSILGSEFDLLSRKYGIRFVISAGNHSLLRTQDSLEDIIEDDDSRIAPPADAMLGITVGAVVGYEHLNSLSRINEIAPYSRRGPGFSGSYKPDLVAFGATQLQNGITPSDPYAICLTNAGFCPLSGTSFTAPTVAGDLAQILPFANNDIGLAQALLYNGVMPLYDRSGMQQDEMILARNLYGRGLSAPEISMHSSEDRVSFLNTGTMNRLTKKHVKFYIPSAIANLNVKRGKDKIRVTVTCIAQPPIDRTKGSEYSAAYISASIHRLNAKGNMVVDNPPSGCDNRNKWDTCYHFRNEFSSFESGSWEVWLELFTRWDIKDDEEIPYSIVITVEDLTKSGNLYSETVKESAGRFTQIQPIRITIH